MTQYVLNLSYGKDSLACLGAIKHLGWPLDRIVHSEVWATDTIPADLPPMVEFKKKADKIIKDRYGIEVEHICALKTQGRAVAKKHTNPCSIMNCKAENLQEQSKDSLKQSEVGAKSSNMSTTALTYEDIFYRVSQGKKHKGEIYGFPIMNANWCTNLLKTDVLDNFIRSQIIQVERETEPQIVQYLGIAADEPLRIKKHINRPGIILPLYEIKWDEDLCGLWCQYSDLLSPIYENTCRGGCWFCHNQSVDQLRLLRRNYPDLWALLLKWDSDSPVSFKPDGTTVHDFDKRFRMEDEGIILPNDSTFRWKQVRGEVDVQIKLF